MAAVTVRDLVFALKGQFAARARARTVSILNLKREREADRTIEPNGGNDRNRIDPTASADQLHLDSRLAEAGDR